MLDIIQKKYADFIVRPYLQKHLQKPRLYKYESLRLKIYPGVFHPAYFFSTKFLLGFLNMIHLNNKTFCEVGAGSGVLSFTAFKKGALVTAIELNITAFKGLQENLKNNFNTSHDFSLYHSDLFDSVPQQIFDIIVINPPYFFKTITSDESLAWNCGANGEYFKKLFSQLRHYSNVSSEIYMSLAENCDVERIKRIALTEGFNMALILEKKIKWEKNFIFKLNLKPGIY